MCRLLGELERQGVQVSRMRALEAYARAGDWYALDYAHRVASLDAWEIDPQFEQALRRNLPRATVKITDSYREIETTDKQFDFVVLDAPIQPFGEHCEHFDMFPAVFRVLPESAVLVVNIVSQVDCTIRCRYPALFNERHLRRRAEFYETDHPAALTIGEIVGTYRRLLAKHGFELPWHAVQERSFFSYLAMQTQRVEAVL
jgi:hypothetical protein